MSANPPQVAAGKDALIKNDFYQQKFCSIIRIGRCTGFQIQTTVQLYSMRRGGDQNRRGPATDLSSLESHLQQIFPAGWKFSVQNYLGSCHWLTDPLIMEHNKTNHWMSKSYPGDFPPLRHLIRVIRRCDLTSPTNQTTKTETKTIKITTKCHAWLVNSRLSSA